MISNRPTYLAPSASPTIIHNIDLIALKQRDIKGKKKTFN